MPSAGALIWVSVKPLLKLIITTSFGFFLTKADLFGAVAARGAGQVMLNIFVPALLFSKIVTGFTAENIVALGPLILVACIYLLYGLVIAWLTRTIFWVPHRFQYGILAAGVWSNWGDIPLSVIMSMTASTPFESGDSDVAVAYVSAFILVSVVTMFPLGGYRVVAKDYADGVMPSDADDEPTTSTTHGLARRWSRFRTTIRNRAGVRADPDLEGPAEGEKSQSAPQNETEIVAPQPRATARHVSFHPSEPTAYSGYEGGKSARPAASEQTSPAPTATATEGIASAMLQHPKEPAAEAEALSGASADLGRLKRARVAIRGFLIALATPATVTMAVSFVVALVPTLKALFIAPPAGSRVYISPAPDGLPPLNIILDTATFIGNASVSLGLICLGSALARLQVPKPIHRAPLRAIVVFSILKMIIGPIFGVLVVEALTRHTRLIDPNDKVLRFVCIYFSGVPTATTQVYLTQIYSPDGSAHHISAFLIPQYALMFVTMTALSAYTLNILF